MCSDQSFTISGGKVGVLLLHRLCGTPVEMRYVASSLAKQGFTVSCPRLAGHGGSLDDLSATTWQDWYRSAEDALIELKRTCDTVIVGGLSTGAVLAVLLAARQPNLVAGTALLSPTLWLNGWMIPWYACLFRLIRQKWIARLFSFPHHDPYGIKDERIREFIQRARSANGAAATGHAVTPGSAFFEHGELVREATRVASTVTQPSLIVHPRDDDYANLSNATYLCDALRGGAELVVLDDCYHIVTVDRQRHLVVDAMQRFLSQFASPAAANAATVTEINAAA